ncbi:LOW QUALITY PROTEIN: agmatinase, mitochondrial [Sebastes umbrosus]|uniref:LOW QUALITY PROTEIN: agmatinase, mitochondrial n=1 Tax=Sebastes umbrosus TaxID=72105 RepID=UPI00189D3D6A|nr:LOW QUALITY PROTEIN: agmatinase, mitochondrial [Sebastes umbrosus]
MSGQQSQQKELRETFQCATERRVCRPGVGDPHHGQAAFPGDRGGAGRGVYRGAHRYRDIQPTRSKVWPRQIRVESAMLRSYNSGTRAAPYESLMVADIGDVNVNVYDLKDTCRRIREAYRKILATGCIPLTMGGDHTIAYPILQAVAERHGPVGLVHVDAHADTSDVVLGEKIGHGTPFRRCVEEGLLDCKRVVQIGLRGSGYSPDSYEWSRAQGFRVVQVEECWFKSLAPLMAEVRAQMGSGPVYLSFDIDALDPGFAPGTGTPEIAGLTPIQGVEIIRGCRGLNLVGCDLVEVSPPYDTTGNTAVTGANLLFEMLCVLPKIKYY